MTDTQIHNYIVFLVIFFIIAVIIWIRKDFETAATVFILSAAALFALMSWNGVESGTMSPVFRNLVLAGAVFLIFAINYGFVGCALIVLILGPLVAGEYFIIRYINDPEFLTETIGLSEELAETHLMITVICAIMFALIWFCIILWGPGNILYKREKKKEEKEAELKKEEEEKAKKEAEKKAKIQRIHEATKKYGRVFVPDYDGESYIEFANANEQRAYEEEKKKNGLVISSDIDGNKWLDYHGTMVPLATETEGPDFPVFPTVSPSEEKTYRKTYTKEKTRYPSIREYTENMLAEKRKSVENEFMLKQLRKMHKKKGVENENVNAGGETV